MNIFKMNVYLDEKQIEEKNESVREKKNLMTHDNHNIIDGICYSWADQLT